MNRPRPLITDHRSLITPPEPTFNRLDGSLDGADLPPKHQYALARDHFRRRVHRRIHPLGHRWRHPLPLLYESGNRTGATNPVQPSAPRGRPRHRLPLLPYLGRGLELRRHTTAADVHELPLPDLDERRYAPACPRQL